MYEVRELDGFTVIRLMAESWVCGLCGQFIEPNSEVVYGTQPEKRGTIYQFVHLECYEKIR